MRTLFHWLFHRWEDTEHLAVPGYANLYRQRCTTCQKTRMQNRP